MPIKKKVFACYECGWTMDAEGVGMGPVCPECKAGLYIVEGTETEIANLLEKLNKKRR